MKLLCILILALALVSAQDAPAEADSAYNDDYDSYYDYDTIKKELDKLDLADEAKVQDDIKKYMYDDTLAFYDDKDLDDDYDIEDEKTDVKESDNEEKKEDAADYALLWGDDSVAPLPVPESEPIVNDEGDETEAKLEPNDKIVEETLKILEDTNDAFDEQQSKDIDEPKVNESADESLPDAKIVEETIDILGHLDDAFDADVDDNKLNQEIVEDIKPISIEIASKEEAKPEEFSDDDTVDNVKADLNADLDKLFETIDKLSVDDPAQEEAIVEKVDSELFKDGPEVSDENNDDYEEVDFDKILEDLNNELAANSKQDDPKPEIKDIVNDELNEPNPEDPVEKDAEIVSKETELKNKPILFLDAIPNAESIESNQDEETDASIETNDDAKETNLDKDAEEKNIDIENLDVEELNGLVKQFSDTHLELLDAKDTFNDDTAEHIKLSVAEPVVITSPNYPNPYFANNVKDWVFTGEGSGIELNITDFLVNGAVGHYLLVKPGGVDDSGHGGLLFTYRLDSEKRFRFSDVDQLFVRFDAAQAGWGMRGFQLSARMIAPTPEEPAPLPTPAPVLPPPHSTFTLHLATTAAQFHQQRDAFKTLLADMAELYVEDNDVDPGLNATSEVVQITSVGACPLNWPSHELCTAVTFGVPLAYADEGVLMLDESALEEMWRSYSVRDPFALRLRQMGIAEFVPPSSVLHAWLLIGCGVLLAAVLAVLLLYRFHCFQDYTRMKDMNDTDSLHNEKRGLDLYPTPHQTLPPLYSELDYKWPDNEDTTRVDMSGHSNRSYARDMYDFESDEELPPRTGTGPRDSFAQRNSNA